MYRSLLPLFRLRAWLLLRRRRWQRGRAVSLPPNVNQITDQLFVGGFIDADDWRQLYSQGITVDVSLQAERVDDFGGMIPDGYLWLPTMDYTPPTQEAIHAGVAFILAALSQGKRVLIHCHAGKGRSALLCAAALVGGGMPLEQAWQLVKSQRPGAFLHGPQLEALKTFAAAIAAQDAAIAGDLD